MMKKGFKRLIASLLAIIIVASYAVPVQAATYRNGAQSGPSSSYKNGIYYENYTRVPITGDNRTDLIAIALSQLGYQEGASNGAFSGEVAGSANYVEYSYNLGDLGLGYGGSDYPWCACFVTWCLYQSHCTDQATWKSLGRYHSGDYTYIWKEISCSQWVRQLKGAGYYKYSAYEGGSYTPKAGDLVFFQNSNGVAHIGICLYTSGGRIYTVEGNTSDSSGLETNGGGVYFKNYSLSTSYINGYGVLPYVEDSSVPDIDYSGSNPTPGLYVANATKYIYGSETDTTYDYILDRFSMFEVTEVCSNGRLKGIFTERNGSTVTGYISNNSDRVIQLSTTETSAADTARTNLQAAINQALDIRHYNYTEAKILEIRAAYNDAVSLLANTSATEAQLKSATTTLTDLMAQTGSNTIALNNEGVYINGRNSVIGAGDCFIFSPTFNDGLITVDNANIRYTLNVVFKWDETQRLNVVKSISEGTGNSTPSIQLEADEFLVACHNWETGVSASDNPVEYSGTNYRILASLEVGDAVKLSGCTALNANTDVEPAAYLKFMGKDAPHINGRNEIVEKGDFHLFTPEFNQGLLTWSNANVHKTLNVIAQWDNDKSAWVVVNKFHGDGTEGEASNIELAEDQVLIAGYAWEGGVTDGTAVYGSTANWQKLNTAEVGQKVIFSGVSPTAGVTTLSLAANIDFVDFEDDGSDDSVITGPVNLASGKDYEITLPGTAAHTADLTDGQYVTEMELTGGWFGFLTGDSENCNTVDGVGTVVIDLGARYDLDAIQAHVYAGENPYSVAAPAYINVSVSANGTDFVSVGSLSMDAAATASYWATLADAGTTGRYVKFEVGPSGQSAWVFLNELEVYGTSLTGEENIALNTTVQTTAPSDLTFNASLIDGIYVDEIVDNGWFGFDSSNTTDGVGTVVIDLAEKYKISDIKAHLFAGENSISAGAPASVVVWVSTDGTNYAKAGSLTLDESADTAYWAALTDESIVGRYVKLEVTCDDAWTLLNEVEIYGTTYVASDDNNIALGKDTVVSSFAGSGFTADLTDGVASNIFQYNVNNSSWFAFLNTGDATTGNTTDGKGIVTIDLGGQAEINSLLVHLFAGTNDAGAVQPNNVNAYISSDGVSFDYIQTLTPDQTASAAYWLSYDLSTPVYGRYVKFAFFTDTDDLVLLNEIKINGLMLTSDEADEPGSISTVTLAGTFNNWNSTPNMQTVDSAIVSASLTLEKGEHEFKILFGNEWYGNDTAITNGTTENLTLHTDSGNCKLTASVAGTYNFTFNRETKELSVTYLPDTLYLRGSFNEWDTDLLMVDNGDGTYSITTNLAGGTYEFKIANEDYSTEWPASNYVLEVARKSDVTVTLNIYTDEITVTQVPSEYTVTFVDYNGTVLSTQTVATGTAATAPSVSAREGYAFIGWDKKFDNVTEDLIVTAQYTVSIGKLKVDVSGGAGFTISVNGGAARPQGNSYYNTKMEIGSTITVTANQVSGSSFLGWVNAATNQIVSTDLSYTFYASGNDHYSAMFTCEIEGVNLVIFMNDKTSQILDMQYYAAGDEIIVPAEPSNPSYDFAGWQYSVEEIQAKLEAGEDVTVNATWIKKQVYVNVTVTGGTVTAHSGMNDSGQYLASYALTITADEAPEGQKFAYWTDGNGVIKSYNSTYKFYPAVDTAMTAVFVDEAAEIDYQVLVNVDAADTTSVDGKIIFYFSWYVPEEQEGLTYVHAGILGVNKLYYDEDTFYAGTSDTNVYDRGPATGNAYNTAENTFSWTKGSISEGDTWVVRAYVQYYDAEGNLITVYSDLVEATK